MYFIQRSAPEGLLAHLPCRLLNVVGHRVLLLLQIILRTFLSTYRLVFKTYINSLHRLVLRLENTTHFAELVDLVTRIQAVRAALPSEPCARFAITRGFVPATSSHKQDFKMNAQGRHKYTR
jgi:hypothetical protein